LRRVLLLGTGNSDYLDVLFQPELRIACVETLIRSLHAFADRWDECNFQQLRPTSALLQSTGHVEGLRIYQELHGVCPRLSLSSPDTAPMLKKVRYYQRRLARDHPFTIAQATTANAERILAELARLHGRRWHAKGRAGVLSDRDRSFHRAVVQRFSDTPMLNLYALETSAQTLAAVYAFLHRKHFYLYLSGFDPEFSTLSVGSVLLAHTIEEARRKGCRTFDFLRGREEYKYKWGARDEHTFTKIIRKTAPKP
jgi:CelD/BcsL family acetyltransferase involved in cellulose biosynthesis